MKCSSGLGPLSMPRSVKTQHLPEGSAKAIRLGSTRKSSGFLLDGEALPAIVTETARIYPIYCRPWSGISIPVSVKGDATCELGVTRS